MRSSTALFAIAGTVIPAVQAHMSIWHPAGYSFNQGDKAVHPLANLDFNSWWFHGYVNEKPAEVLELVPGQDLTLQIACSKRWTTYGGSDSSDACPSDSGSYHAGGTSFVEAGWQGNDESAVMGCALAIAYESDPLAVKPEDFIVMSVQERCVRQRDTPFSIPSNLPACPEGGCTCSWFWAGKNSALEMYMSAFRCDVQGGVATSSYPRPVEPRKNAINGPTQPFYWANDLNNLGYTPQWADKPSYNSAFGWTNGAQEMAFGPGTGSGNGGNGSGTGNTTSSASSAWSEPTPSDESTPTSSRRYRPRPTRTATQAWNNLAAIPSDKTKHCERRRSRRH